MHREAGVAHHLGELGSRDNGQSPALDRYSVSPSPLTLGKELPHEDSCSLSRNTYLMSIK